MATYYDELGGCLEDFLMDSLGQWVVEYGRGKRIADLIGEEFVSIELRATVYKTGRVQLTASVTPTKPWKSEHYAAKVHIGESLSNALKQHQAHPEL